MDKQSPVRVSRLNQMPRGTILFTYAERRPEPLMFWRPTSYRRVVEWAEAAEEDSKPSNQHPGISERLSWSDISDSPARHRDCRLTLSE